jgi:hypothetical protein
MPTSNRHTGSHSRQSTALSDADCGQCCANRSTDRVRDDVVRITNNDQMLSSLILGCSPCLQPINWRANPDVETTDWRARRGRTAHRVRREGTARAVPYPYPLAGSRWTGWPHLHPHPTQPVIRHQIALPETVIDSLIKRPRLGPERGRSGLTPALHARETR